MATRLIQNGNAAGGGASSSDIQVIHEALPSVHYPEYAGGAKGDGINNDWPAFEAALSSRPNRSWQGFIPPGKYKMADAGGVTKSLVTGQATRLTGAGPLMSHQVTSGISYTYNTPTILDFSGAAVDGIVSPLDAAQNYRAQAPEIRMMSIFGSGRTNGKSGILWRENTLLSLGVVPRRLVGLAIVQDVQVEKFSIGLNGANSDGSKWHQVTVNDCASGYVDTATIEAKIENLVLWDLDTVAIDTSSARGHIFGCEINPALQAGGTPTAAALILRGKQMGIAENIINSATIGVQILGDLFKLVGNDIGDFGSAGIINDAVVIGLADGSISPTGNVLVGNTIINWGVGGSNRAAIRGYGGMTRSVIANNVASNPAGNGTRGMVFGDGSNAAHPTNLRVIGNSVPASLALPYDFTGTGHVFLGNDPVGVAVPAVSGSRGGNAALASALTALAAQGLITDGSTA